MSHELSAEQLTQYQHSGFLVVRSMFEESEIEPLRSACLADPTIGGALFALADIHGNAQELVSYTDLSDDLVGIIPRIQRMVSTAEKLSGKDLYHWHSKLSMKQPHTEGNWNWHQDFGYWYYQGCLRPDMLTATVAVDRCFSGNGCLKLAEGSHQLGRLDHCRQGQASGADPVFLQRALNKLKVIECVMDPGDVVFFHSNTLHASGPNRSGSPRTLLHCSYNAIDNTPFLTGQESHSYSGPLQVVPDDFIKSGRYASVFDTQPFIEPQDDETGYGYKVLRHNTRPGRKHTVAVGRHL